MAFVLTGIVKGMRALSGVSEQGSRAGERWEFISMEIADPKFCHVYACQMRNTDRQFKDLTEVKRVTDPKTNQQVERSVLKEGKDYTDHKVKVFVSSITAGEREITKKDTQGNEFSEAVMQVRLTVTKIVDLGEPDDDE